MTGSGGPTSPHKRYRQGDDELRLLIPSKVSADRSRDMSRGNVSRGVTFERARTRFRFSPLRFSRTASFAALFPCLPSFLALSPRLSLCAARTPTIGNIQETSAPRRAPFAGAFHVLADWVTIFSSHACSIPAEELFSGANGRAAVCATRETTYYGTSVPSWSDRSTSGDCRYARRTVIAVSVGRFLRLAGNSSRNSRGPRGQVAEDLAACSLPSPAASFHPRRRYVSPDVSRLSGYFLAPPFPPPYNKTRGRVSRLQRPLLSKACERKRERERERRTEYRRSDLSAFPFAR